MDEVEALAGFSLMLLSDVLRCVSKAGFLQEVVLGALIKARIAVVFVGEEEFHWLFVFSDAELVKFVYWIT